MVNILFLRGLVGYANAFMDYVNDDDSCTFFFFVFTSLSTVSLARTRRQPRFFLLVTENEVDALEILILNVALSMF